MIVSKDDVRAAFARSIALDPAEDNAVRAVAQSMALPEDVVREALVDAESEATS